MSCSNSSNINETFIIEGATSGDDIYTTAATYNNITKIASFYRNDDNIYTLDLSGITDYFVTAFTYNNNTFTLKDNSGNTFNAVINEVTGLTVNGTLFANQIGSSGDCINDLYVSEIHSCSPLNINPLDEGNVYFGSTSGVTIDVINKKVGIGVSDPLNAVLSLKRGDNINDSFLTGLDSSGNTLFDIRSNHLISTTFSAVFPFNPFPDTPSPSLYIGLNSGKNAIAVSNSGMSNTALGSNSLSAITSGFSNTAIGSFTLTSLQRGSYNTAIGETVAPIFTGGTGEQGNDNIFIGNKSAERKLSGRYNVFVGTNTFQYNQTGDLNTIIGKNAGQQNQTGSRNVFVGHGAGRFGTSSSGNTFLGTGVGAFETGSNLLYIDNSTTSTPLIWGDFANDLLRFNAKVGVNVLNSTYQFDVNGTSRFSNTVQLDTVNLSSGDTKLLTLSSGNIVQYTNVSDITGATSSLLNNYLSLSGGIVTGDTIFTNGLTATTISATTYLNLPTDTLLWYDENDTAPAISPLATGYGSIALGNGAMALGSSMFVYGEYAGSGATGSSESNFIGVCAGYSACDSDGSNFFGRNAGECACNSRWSNFIGTNAGYSACNSPESNFIGAGAGDNACDSSESNFIGQVAGESACCSYFSNFIGVYAGNNACDSYKSNFIGCFAGESAYSSPNSNFIGTNAGYRADNSSESNFIGTDAGFGASGSSCSNFIGNQAGYQACNSSRSNFIGQGVGYLSSGSFRSNFIGDNAGSQSQNASCSNFIGFASGGNAANIQNSNFIGTLAGCGSINSSCSNFIGVCAGCNACNSCFSDFIGARAAGNACNSCISVFLGPRAGDNAKFSSNSILIGFCAGAAMSASCSSIFIGFATGRFACNSCQSNFIGDTAGEHACSTICSNFIGTAAGRCAKNTNFSNFIGLCGGGCACDSCNSNFIGNSAGRLALNACSSNFIGTSAGATACHSCCSNFIGFQAGFNAISACTNNFIGIQAGNFARNSCFSNFMGYNAGWSTCNTCFSNFMGYKAGESFSFNRIGNNNIIIGTNISLPSGTTNSINIGGVLFGTGAYSTTSGNPSTTFATSGRIGIGVVAPTNRLHVNDTTDPVKFEGLQISSTDTRILSTDSTGVIRYRNFTDFSADTYTTGGTYTNATGTLELRDSSGNTITITGFTTGATGSISGDYLPLSGGTVTGDTIFTSGLTATTISGGTLYGDGSNLTNIDNIYTVNGALLSNRIVDLSGNTLSLRITNNRSDSFLNGLDQSGNTLFEVRSAYNQIEPSLPSLHFGKNSGLLSTSIYANTSFGSDTLSAVTTGFRNTAFGARSLSALVNGSFNTAIGELAAPIFTGGTGNTGNNNVFIGNGAALNKLTGRWNVIIGANALNDNITGDFNTILGTGAGARNQTGNRNTLIGVSAGRDNVSGSGNTFMGYEAGRFESGSDLLYIDNTSTATPLIWGDFANDYLRFNAKVGVNVLNTTHDLYVNGTSKFGNTVQLDTVNLSSGDTKILTLSSGSIVQYTNVSDITGATSADTFTTAFTYNNNTFTISDNSGSTFNATINTVTGFTVNGILTVTGNTYVQDLTGRTAVFSSSSQNVVTIIGSGNSSSSPLFSVIGSQGELFTVSDTLNGSLFSVNDISGLPVLEAFSDDRILMGSYLAPSLNTTKKVTLTAGTNSVYSIPTSAYTGAFFEYTLISSGATGARAGSIMSIWSGTTAQFTEVTTNDIGSTTDVTFSVGVSGNNAVLSSSATTSGWILKTIIRSI